MITSYFCLLGVKPGYWPWTEDTDYGFEISDFHSEISHSGLPEALSGVASWVFTDISEKSAATFSSVFHKIGILLRL